MKETNIHYPLVSVIVPIYNVSEYIEECATAIFQQSYSNIEYIFVNDCSPDDSIDKLEKIIELYPERKKNITILHHKMNMGLAQARNTGIDASHGEYLIHIDSDDAITPNAIKDLVEEGKKTDADLVICNFKYLYSDGVSKIVVDNLPSNKEEYVKSLLTRKSIVNIIGKLIRRQLIIDYNIFALPGVNMSEDFLVTPQIAYYAKKIAKVDKSLYLYNRRNVASYTANLTKKGIDDTIKVQQYLIDFFKQQSDYESYSSVITESCLLTKISLLIMSPFQLYSTIAELYGEIEYNKCNINLKFKIVLFLLKIRKYKILYNIIGWYKSQNQ